MSDKIKSIKTFQIDEVSGKDGYLKAYEERDPLGNITLFIQYNEAEDIEQKTERIFNGKGQLIEEKQYTTGEIPDQQITYEYNESGMVALATVRYLDGSASFRKYLRDEAQNTTTIESTDQDGEFEGSEFRRFDGEGKVLEEIFYDSENNITEKTETEYDDYGRVIEMVALDTEGFETVRFYDYYNNDEGRVIKIETLNEDEVIIRIDELDYDEKGNQTTHKIIDKSKGVMTTNIWEYNPDNLVVSFKNMVGENLIEEVKTSYRADKLLAEQETLNRNGAILNSFEYEFH